MKSGLYLKLSVNGIKKNKKLYLPYLITCICMVMMFYLIDYLAVSPQFAKIKGGDTMQMILGFGSGVISIFSLILLYYTNSFLIRRRQREFGLYHILGMGKIDLVKIMVLENLIISVLTIAGGIVGGILFSKLGELLAAKILGSNAGLSMKISVPALVATALLFLVIFALIMLRMIVSVYRLKPDLCSTRVASAWCGLLFIPDNQRSACSDDLVYGCRRAGNPCNVSVIYCRLGHIL